MTVTVERRGKIELDIAGALDWLSAQVVGLIQRRSARGISSDGSPMKPYSAGYKNALLSVGESDKVDLTRSGGYLGSISERSRTVSANGGTVMIGPGTGTSREMPLPPPYVFSASKTPEQRAAAFEAWKRAPKRPGRSPPHNILGAILEKDRPHMGLTPEERRELAGKLSKVLLKQGR